MEHDFWRTRWQEKRIGFHEEQGNQLLAKKFESFMSESELKESTKRIFVPLCGKTNDLIWLRQKGYHVVGVELVESAVQDFFVAQNLEPDITMVDGFKVYQTDGVQIFVGDVFELTKVHLGKIDCVYDRAALVALPDDMRKRYAKHLIRITNVAKQFLITLHYDQSIKKGPPFAIDEEMVTALYGGDFDADLRQENELPIDHNGKFPVTEKLFWLQPKQPS